MNLRHFYYRGYYDGLDYQKIIDGRAKTDKALGEWFARKNRVLFAYSAPQSAIELLTPAENKMGELEGYTEILLQTGGQGLLTGSGYAHETGSLGELKLGFHFEPTTGLPTLPGHSIKGVLRSAFPQKYESDGVKTGKAKWIAEILRKSAVDVPQGGEAAFLEKLEKAIFEGIDFVATEKARTKAKSEGKRDLEKIFCTAPMAKHDIFLEATLTQPGLFLGRDALAPHDRTPNKEGLKNPIPIPFVKVLPGIPFRFAFLLKNSTIDGVDVPPSAKKALFEVILTTFGAGAKTRGGYGVFEKMAAPPPPPKPKVGEGLLENIPAYRFKEKPIRTTETYEAMAMGAKEKDGKVKSIFVLFIGKPGEGTRHLQKWPVTLPVGEVILVKVRITGNGDIQEIYPAP